MCAFGGMHGDHFSMSPRRIVTQVFVKLHVHLAQVGEISYILLLGRVKLTEIF